MSGFSTIGAITENKKCKNNHNWLLVDEVQIFEGEQPMIKSVYQCSVCWSETSDKRKGKLKETSFLSSIRKFFKI